MNNSERISAAMKKINPYDITNVPSEHEESLWVGVEDNCLAVATSQDGPKVLLTDQMLVWLAIEGLCQLRDVVGLRDDLDIPIACKCGCGETPAIADVAAVMEERCSHGNSFMPPSESKE